MKIKEVADIAGISVRTLHHYDAIGLLKPEKTTDSGYRIYSDADLETLQQILFFKELGFPLKKIREIIHHPSFNQYEAFTMQRKMLLEERSRLDKMIAMIDKTIQHKKGEVIMSHQERFAGFDFSHNPYEKEARERWGDHAVETMHAQMKQQPNDKDGSMEEKFNAVYRKLAGIRMEAPDSKAAQEAIKEWYDILNGIGNYSPQAFKGLGQMYVQDERFTKNIDQFGEGLAAFMCDAMAFFADKQK